MGSPASKVRLAAGRGRTFIAYYRPGGRIDWYDEDADPLCAHPVYGVPERLRREAARIAPDWWKADLEADSE